MGSNKNHRHLKILAKLFFDLIVIMYVLKDPANLFVLLESTSINPEVSSDLSYLDVVLSKQIRTYLIWKLGALQQNYQC